mgnify:CR=1 FL=1
MKEMAFQKRKEPSMTLLADKHKSDRSNITFGKGGIWAGLKSMFNSKKPFRTVIFAPIALAVILCFWLALGRSTNLPNNKDSDGTTIPNEAPIKIYYLENATNRDKLERLSSVAL